MLRKKKFLVRSTSLNRNSYYRSKRENPRVVSQLIPPSPRPYRVGEAFVMCINYFFHNKKHLF